MTTEIETLDQLTTTMPIDGPTGLPCEDSDGVADNPSDYEVIEHVRTNEGFRALVRGPSGDTDFVVNDVTGCRIYRDTDYTLLFERDGDNLPDSYWKIEETPDGLLVATSNAETRQPLSSDSYIGWSPSDLHDPLVAAGVPRELIARIFAQVGMDMPEVEPSE